MTTIFPTPTASVPTAFATPSSGSPSLAGGAVTTTVRDARELLPTYGVSADDVELHSAARRLSHAALDALVELAALTETTDAASAEATYRQAIATDPCHIAAYGQLSALLSQQGRHDDALALIDQAVGWCGDIAALHYHCGATQESAGRLGEAIEAYERALALDPALADAHYRLGSLCERLDAPVASARHFRAYHRLVAQHASDSRLS